MFKIGDKIVPKTEKAIADCKGYGWIGGPIIVVVGSLDNPPYSQFDLPQYKNIVFTTQIFN